MKKNFDYVAPTASVVELKTSDIVTVSQDHISMSVVAEDILIDAFDFGGSF